MKDGFLLINKQSDWTSRDVCNKLSHMFSLEKVGHNGTLDPFASGLLLIACGKATKLLPFIDDSLKKYQAKLILGKKSSTGDLTGDVVEEKTITPVSLENIQVVFNLLKGHQKQIPPMTSAVHFNGRKLYELAHEGKEVERTPRDIFIESLNLIDFSDNFIEFEAIVSKGTYIRTLGETIAEKLNNVGYLSSLKRTAIGSFTLDSSKEIENVKEEDFVNMELIVKDYMEVICFHDEASLKKIAHGGKLSIKLFDETKEIFCAADKDGHLLAVYQNKGNEYYFCARNLN